MKESIDVLAHISSALNRRDELPNQELALKIVRLQDKTAIENLVLNLTNKNRAVQNDCIKVIYEIGEEEPKLISAYFENFLALLTHRNNRLQWGCMTALNSIAKEKPGKIYDNLSILLTAADAGSVITKDNAVNILITLASMKKYSEGAFSLLIEQLLKSAPTQFPMYAERSIPVINEKNRTKFLEVLQLRLQDMEKESSKKRITRILKKLT